MTHYFEREGKNEQYHKIDKMDNTETLDTLENWKKKWTNWIPKLFYCFTYGFISFEYASK